MTDFAAQIDALDGLHETLVTHRCGMWEVMVGGGPDRFVLTATSGDQVVNALTADDEGDFDEDTFDLTVGGQAVDYPVCYVLRRDEVDTAVDELALTPRAEELPASRWER